MVLEINGNATILQPRPPSTNQSNVVGQKSKPGRKLKDPAAATAATKPTKMTEIVSKKILERFLHVGEAFLAFDKDRRGAIAEEDIKTGLHNWGFDLSDNALSDICQRFQHNEQGLIDYKAFCDYFADTLEGSGSLLAKRQARHYLDPRKAGQMNPRLQQLAGLTTTEEVVDAVEVEIRKKLTDQFKSVRSAFLFFDADRSGRIHMDEFARVLERFGIVLNQQELDELQKRTEEEHAAAELNVPARKKRDAIFSSYEAQDEKAILAANMKADKMRRGIRYEDFVKHFGSVLQPSQTDRDGSDFHNQDRNQGEHKKRVGHKASHKIFGSKTTSTEGKIAQKQLAKRLFSGYHELHDALVFHDRTMSGALANARFVEILERYGARNDTALKLATKYSVNEPETPKETPTVNYSGFFSVLCDEAGSAFRSYFSEENIVLQIGVSAEEISRRNDPLSKSIEHQVALQFATKEGIPRVLSTWKLFDRANSGKITGGEFVNALRNTRAGRTMPQRGATALSELYDLDGTGRCDYVAFSRSFRTDVMAAAGTINKSANLRKGSLLVNTARNADQFWKTHALDTAAKDAALAAEAKHLSSKQIKKRGRLLPDRTIHALHSEKLKSPRFRASFDTHQLVQKFQTELSKHWKTFRKLFRKYDTKNSGYISPSRFAKIITSKTLATMPKTQIDRLALAFVDFQKENKPMVSYKRFMKQLVLEPMRPQAGRRRPVTRPTPSKTRIIATPSRPRPETSNGTGSDAAAQQNVAQSRQRGASAKDISQSCTYSVYGRWKVIRRIFAKVDDKRTGLVSQKIFCETMQKMAFAVTQDDYSAIRVRFRRNGGIQYHNFLRHVLTLFQKDCKKNLSAGK